MKSISIDRALCDKSDDMSFNKRNYDFTTKNMFFSIISCFLAGNDVIRKEE